MTTFAGQWGPEALINTVGSPYLSTAFTVMASGTSTPATLYGDRTKGSTVSNPGRSTDPKGNATFFVDPGTYDIAVLGVVVLPGVRVFADDADIGALIPSGTYAQSSFLGWFIVDAYPGSTADAKFAAALAAWAASASGGTIWFGDGPYAMANAWQPMLGSFDGAIFSQKFLRITGTGAGHNGRWGDPSGGTVIDMTYNGAAPAKIDTRGVGTIELDHINFKDSSGSAKPFFQTTNTTPKIHDCTFQGSKTGAACDQDVLVMGGTTIDIDGSATAAFQGYGGFVRNNYFDKIRRGVLCRVYCNGLPITGNTWSTRCGADATAAAIELAGGVDNCTGITTRDNVIECVHYVYGILATKALLNNFGPDGFYDPEVGTFLACHRFAATATFNMVVDGQHNDTFPLVSETGASIDTNTKITSHASQETLFAQKVRFAWSGGTTFSTPLIVSGGGGGITIQPEVAVSDATVLWQVLRSAAEGSNPGTTIAFLQQNGTLAIGGGTSRVLLYDAAGTFQTSMSGAGITRSGAGGGMVLDSGSGGSYIDLKGFGFRVKSWLDGAVLHTLNFSGVGFNGVAAFAQAATPTTLADVIAIVRGVGLAA